MTTNIMQIYRYDSYTVHVDFVDPDGYKWRKKLDIQGNGKNENDWIYEQIIEALIWTNSGSHDLISRGREPRSADNE